LGDLAETLPARVLEPDPVDDALRQRPWPAGGPSTRAITRWLEVISQESFELRDGNEPLTPRRLDCAHRRNEATVDGRDADPESFGSLLAAVGEAGRLVNLAQLARPSPTDLRLPYVVPSLLLAASLPSGRHRGAYSNPCFG
jgi:hypothetical protein